MFVKNFGCGSRWLPGKIVQVSGPVSFHVELEDGRHRKYNQDHLRHRVVDDGGPEMSQVAPDDSLEVGPSKSEYPPSQGAGTAASPEHSNNPTESIESTSRSSSAVCNTPPETTTRRYPLHNRRATERFEAGFD